MLRPASFLLLLAGCASAASTSLFNMSDAQRERATLSALAPPRDNCQQSATAPRFTPVELVDTVALAPFARMAMAADDFVVVAVSWDTAGTAPAITPVELGVSEATWREMQPRIEASLRPPAGSGRHRLRIEGDGAMRTAPSVSCLPSILNRDNVSRLMQHMIDAAGLNTHLHRARSAIVQVQVLATGEATVDNVFESSGYPEIDAIALQAARHARFQPAVIDGVPVEVWVRLPMTFQLARPESRQPPS